MDITPLGQPSRLIVYHEYMDENLPVVETFFHKREYINLILDKECNKTMSTKVKIGKKNGIEIDSGIIFQRLLGVKDFLQVFQGSRI